MFQFIKDNVQYRELRKQQIEKAELQSQHLDQPADDFLVTTFDKIKAESLGGANSGSRRTEIRTPVKLKPLLEQMLSLPPELSAWLIMYKVGKAILKARLPLELQGDIMMAFEVVNYILPEKTPEAAGHLACALCILPSLGRARATLAGLGAPFHEKGLSQEDVTALIKQGFLPEGVITSTNALVRLGWNLEMREAVVSELNRKVLNANHLFQIDKMQKTEHQELRRLASRPDPVAEDLLQKAMEEPDLQKACDLYAQAGRIDPVLMPDVFRNQAWILAKWKRYEDAVGLLRLALEEDSGYAEVWYHLGICLTKLQQFTEALGAFEKAKLLGLRKAGLEPNMAACRRAIANGLR